VAVDHGLFGEPSFLAGIEDLPAAIATLVAAGPDAIQLAPGTAPLLQTMRVSPRPALVMRTDVANVYGSSPPPELYSELVPQAVDRAVRLDAACVVVNLLSLPGRPDVHRACVRNVSTLRADCDRWGMPLMVEPLVMRTGGGGYDVDGDPERIVTLVRQAVELGADIIKADPTDPPEAYGRVIEVAAGRPVLVRGGGRAPDAEVLARVEAVMGLGAAGVVYGRNVIQHPRPEGMVRALMALVHDGASAEGAAALLAGGG
jgi:DhnA family fructose-bisphosphate aldolase class Ia